MTPNALLSLALLDAGIFGQGQTPRGMDMNNALTRLNWLLNQWNRKRWLIYHLVDVPLISTGAVSYTVGLGGNFNIPRPDRLEGGCFLRILNTGGGQQTDYMLRLIQSREDYNRIVLKSMGTFPSTIFYDSDYPLGVVYPWPVPQATTYEIHLLVKETLTAFTSLSQTINLPPEYEVALYAVMKQRLRSAYRLPSVPEIDAEAKDAMATIRGANVQIATLRMPNSLVGRQRPYNVFSDGYG